MKRLVAIGLIWLMAVSTVLAGCAQPAEKPKVEKAVTSPFSFDYEINSKTVRSFTEGDSFDTIWAASP